MNIRCSNCGHMNSVPRRSRNVQYKCYHCGAFLPKPNTSGDTSAAVGLIGGAAVGAAIAGPFGAIIGGIVGAVLGREAKGVG